MHVFKKGGVMTLAYYYICYNSHIGKVVHHKDCRLLRNNQKKFLGTFHDYPQAVATAQKADPETDHCQACLELQHQNEALIPAEPASKIMSAVSLSKNKPSEAIPGEGKAKSAGYVIRILRKHSPSVSVPERNDDE